jgi:hypothetical protein
MSGGVPIRDGATRHSVAWFLLHCSIDLDEAEVAMNSNLEREPAAGHPPTETSEGLRALAAWYRDYAEQAGSTVIWDYRLSTAEELERQASALELQAKRVQ